MIASFFVKPDRLTDRDLALLRAVAEYERETNGLAPSIRELAKRLGLRSHTTAYWRVLRLQRTGHLTMVKLSEEGKAKANSVRLTETARERIWAKKH